MSDEAEEKAARIRRAREVMDGADWLFKEHAEALKSEWINSLPDDTDGRERLYQKLHAVIGLKAILISILDNAANDEALRDRNRS